MELVFHKENGLYITEFEVTSDFNVHLERSKGGKVSFYQKTTDGNYDHIEKLSKNIDKVFDYDFQALVYPKIIKITSECEFDVASLTTDGEVTEIKSQSKEVEIVSNGVTEIAPDAGFGYLSGVKVNVNVPQSGGGESGGGGLEYINLGGVTLFDENNNPDYELAAILLIAYQVNATLSNGRVIGPMTVTGTARPTTKFNAMSMNFSDMIQMDAGGSLITLKEYVLLNGWTEEKLASLPRITKEEFYNTEA